MTEQPPASSTHWHTWLTSRDLRGVCVARMIDGKFPG